jgi:hypothetical protein
MNNKNLIVILAVGAIVFLLMRKPQPASAGGLTSPEGSFLDRLLPWYQSQRGTTQNAQPNILVSGVSRQDNLGQYIATGGKALSDLVRAVGSVWPRTQSNNAAVKGNTSAPSIVPLTSNAGSYYDWNAFDSFLTGPQGPLTGPIDRPNYVIDWNRQ